VLIVKIEPPMTVDTQILLLEDEPAIASAIAFALQREGFALTHCPLVRDARREIAARHFDLAVLDLGLPDGSGLDLCRDLRSNAATGNMPILVLSARSEELDRVLGLELGADDYVAKPFSPRELVARVRALLRRSAQSHIFSAAKLQASRDNTSDFAVDAAGQRITYRGQPLNLTRREHGLLLTLLQGAGRIYTRDGLLNAVWGQAADSTDRTVDTHIKTLRAKLRTAGAGDDCIITHRGMGYSLEER
jgi:two-component system catabolic regulation response regulator CreB